MATIFITRLEDYFELRYYEFIKLLVRVVVEITLCVVRTNLCKS